MLSAKKRRDIARQIEAMAVGKYGELKRRKVRPPLDQLVQSILWRYASVRRGTKALRELKRGFVDWNEVRVSVVAEIAAAMSTAQWAVRAAEHTRAVLWSLLEARNAVSLEFLEELTLTQARAFLQGLVDVPRDVADEVLLFSLDANVLPLGDDAARMCYRLGLIRNERSTLQNQKDLMVLWDEDHFPAVALFFSDYAARTCRHDRPRHKDCPLDGACPKTGL